MQPNAGCDKNNFPLPREPEQTYSLTKQQTCTLEKFNLLAYLIISNVIAQHHLNIP